jgi:hypothetical protein
LNSTIPLPTNIGTTTIPNPFRRGYVYSSNFIVEHEFFKNLVFQTGYVGTHNVRPVVNMNANASPPGTGNAGGILSQRYGATYKGTINELNPFQNASYDSLQTKINYRMAGGSSAGFSWTWSKAIDYADNEDLGFLAFPYPTDWQKNRALAGYDRTHNIEIWGVIALPFGKGQRWATTGVGNWLLGGWLINPIISKMSGIPFTVTASGGNLNANGATQTADLVGTYHQIGGRPPRTGQTCLENDPTCHFFDPTAFAQPVITCNTNPCPPGSFPAHFGNTNRDQFRGPGYFNMNLSVLRDFKLTERFTLQVRADAIGFTNTPHFANPNVSCPGSSGVCVTGSSTSPSNFGTITSTLTPGGFFGADPGTRTIWFGAAVKF